MLSAKWRILLVDDDEDDFLLTRDMLADLRSGQFQLEWASSYQAAFQVLDEGLFDAVLVDYDLGEHNGIDLIQEAMARGCPSPMILLTARGSYEVDVQAMQAGAADYLNKSEVNAALIERSIRYAIIRRQSEDALRISEESPNPVLRIYKDGQLLYANPASRPLLEGLGCQTGQAVPLDWQEYASEALSTGSKQELEIQFADRIYTCLLVPVVQAGYVNLYMTDVTERERLLHENAVQQAALEQHQVELEHSQAELQRQNDLLEQVIANSPVNILLLEGPEHRYALYNNEHLRFARGKGRLIGRPAAEVWPEIPEITRHLDHVYQSGESKTYIDAPLVVDLGAESRLLYISVSLTPLRSQAGQVDRILVIAIDTSEQMLMRRRVEEEQARLRAIIENAPEGILVADNNLNLIICNHAAFEMLGDPLLEGKNITYESSPFHDPAGVLYQPDELPLTRTIREARTFRNVELSIQSNSGEVRTLLVNSAPVYGAEGEISGGVATLRDITELKQAREWLEAELDERRRTQAQLMQANESLAQTNAALRESEEELLKREKSLRESEGRFRVALAGAPVSVFNMDLDFRYTWVYNPPPFFNSDDVIGKTDAELPGVEDVSEVIAVKRQVIETGRRVVSEVRLRRAGEWLTYIATAEPLLDSDGRLIGLTGATMDVTDKRRLEARQLEYAAQMEVQRRLLQHREMERSQIARNIHDGPIQALISLMFSMQIAQRMAEEDAVQAEEQGEPSSGAVRVAELLAQIRNQAQALVAELREVCNELRPPVLMKFGLGRAICSHAEELQSRHSHLRIDLNLTDDCPRVDDSDGEQGSLPIEQSAVLRDEVRLALYRIYQECMNNIIRHSDANRAAVRLEIEPGGVRLEIQDNGKGFALPEDWVELARQGHLGLVGMRERAAAVGGQVEFSSRPGAGTLVRVTIPR